MHAQEQEYERHLQSLLKQEEIRNLYFYKQQQREQAQRNMKRKWALFRQNQNLELRQHVRLLKLKHKLSLPYKYSYFPLLKQNYLKISDTMTKDDKNSSKKKSKNTSMKRKT